MQAGKARANNNNWVYQQATKKLNSDRKKGQKFKYITPLSQFYMKNKIKSFYNISARPENDPTTSATFDKRTGLEWEADRKNPRRHRDRWEREATKHIWQKIQPILPPSLANQSQYS